MFLFWLISIIFTSAFIFKSFYTVINIIKLIIFFKKNLKLIYFSDVELDYINPIDLCNQLNPFIMPGNNLHNLMNKLFF